MKKFVLAAVAVLAVAGNASAMDRTGKMALGFQESLTTGITGTTSGNSQGAWSVKYGINSQATGQFVVGFDFGTKGNNKRANFGARLLWDLVEHENSDFYTGVGLVFDRDKTGGSGNVLRINVPLGWEFSFAGLPEVGFSAEAGLDYDVKMSGTKSSSLSTVGGTVGGALGLGAHYYF